MALKPNQILIVTRQVLSNPGSFSDIEKYAIKVTFKFDNQNTDLTSIIHNLVAIQVAHDYRLHSPVLLLHFLLPKVSPELKKLTKVVKKLQLVVSFENALGKLNSLKFVLVDAKTLVDDVITHILAELKTKHPTHAGVIPITLKFVPPCYLHTKTSQSQVQDTPGWALHASTIGDTPIVKTSKLSPISNTFANYKKHPAKFSSPLQKVISDLVYTKSEEISDLQPKLMQDIRQSLGSFPNTFISLAKDRSLIDPLVVQCGFKSLHIKFLSEFLENTKRDINLHSLKFFKAPIHPKFLPASKKQGQPMVPYLQKTSLTELTTFQDLISSTLLQQPILYRFNGDTIVPPFEVLVKAQGVFKNVFKKYFSMLSKVLSSIQKFLQEKLGINVPQYDLSKTRAFNLTWQQRLQHAWLLLDQEVLIFSYSFSVEAALILPFILDDMPIYRNVLVYEYDENKGDHVTYAYATLLGIYATFTKTNLQAKLPLFTGAGELLVKAPSLLERSTVPDLPIVLPTQQLEEVAKGFSQAFGNLSSVFGS